VTRGRDVRPGCASGSTYDAPAAVCGQYERVLGRAEREIALIDACVPSNAREERERVLAAWRAQRQVVPRWLLPVRASLAHLRRELDELSAHAGRQDGLAPLYGERAEELAREAALVELRGTERFREACCRRFSLSTEEERGAGVLAREWLDEPVPAEALPPDAGSLAELCPATDLVAALRRRLSELGIVARVELRPELAAIAAVGEGVVYVAAGAELRRDQVERIVLHEVDGHLAPRVRALCEPWGLLRVGSAGAAEDEEGRALLLEARAGYLDPSGERGGSAGGWARRRELALRHLAAGAVRGGAGFVELMRLLLDRGEPLTRAYRLCERVLRGGGLAREVCYLPAYLRVRSALDSAPHLERWFERGRVSVSAARRLELALGPESLS
jgi:hypothetical protein